MTPREVVCLYRSECRRSRGSLGPPWIPYRLRRAPSRDPCVLRHRCRDNYKLEKYQLLEALAQYLEVQIVSIYNSRVESNKALSLK
jgi:hypothetical protein